MLICSGTIMMYNYLIEFDPLWRVNVTIPADVRTKQEFQLVNGFAGIQNMSTLVGFLNLSFVRRKFQNFNIRLNV